MRRLTVAQTRRAHLAAQGLTTPRPTGTPDVGHVMRTVRRMGVLQVDSVNVVERAHHLTLFSRLGRYDTGLLWRALEERRLFEYWAHVASMVPIEDFPLFRHRMEQYRHSLGYWRSLKAAVARHPEYLNRVCAEVAQRGPLTASDLEDPGERKGPWWGWAEGKVALEYLFFSGEVTVSHRTNFARYYDLVERVVPPEQFEAPAIPAPEAHRLLVERSARAMGVATVHELADYFRIGIGDARTAVDHLVGEGRLEPVEVQGQDRPVYAHPQMVVPRSVEARALLNPFDPVVWNRDRTEWLYGLRYRIEIYVPAPKRVYGYYVFPFLLGDELVARVDLKADRKAGVLRVNGAFIEEGQDPVRVAGELAAELGEMAAWLGLGEISVASKGNLVGALRRAV